MTCSRHNSFAAPALTASTGSASPRASSPALYLSFQVLLFDDFQGFPRKQRFRPGYFTSLTSYGSQYRFPVLFTQESIRNGLGEYLSAQGISQLRIAETEKYPHVTYFLSAQQPHTATTPASPTVRRARRTACRHLRSASAVTEQLTITAAEQPSGSRVTRAPRA